MFPSERRDVLHRVRVDAEIGGGELETSRVPEDHGCDNEVQPRGTVRLVLEGAIAQLAELTEKTARASALRASPLLRPP